MLVWDDAQTTCQDLSSDVSSSALTFLKRMMNIGYKEILSELGRPVTERTQTTPTVADQRGYQAPPDTLWPKSVRVQIGSQWYTLMEEESQEMWNYLTATDVTGIPSTFFVRPRFGFSGMEVLLNPIPADVYTLEMVYEATDKDLTTDKYNTGTIALTTGSAVVTGTGTVFTQQMINRYLRATAPTGDGLWYKVVNRTSGTSLTLENVYEGDTQSGLSYQISESFSLPEELHILPVYFSLMHYFGIRREEKQEQKYFTLYKTGVKDAKRRYATKTRSNIIRPKGYVGRTSYPSWFPASISS